jgi:hypothetical protein
VLVTAWRTTAPRGPPMTLAARHASCHWRRYVAAPRALIAPSASARSIAALTVFAGARLTTGFGAAGGAADKGAAVAARASVAALMAGRAPRGISC